MKTINKRTILRTAAAVLLMTAVVGCLYFDGINQPEEADANTVIEYDAQLRIQTLTEGTGRLVFAILAPVDWDLASNATLTLSTKNLTAKNHLYEKNGQTPPFTEEITGEVLELMPETEKTPATVESDKLVSGLPEQDKPWAEALELCSEVGIGGNEGLENVPELKWVVWRSKTIFTITDDSDSNDTDNPEINIYATVHIKLKTGMTPSTFYMGYAYTYDQWGFVTKNARHAVEFKKLTVNPKAMPPIIKPSTFRYGDIFAVQFIPFMTGLENAQDVYLCGKAVYNSGQVAEVTERSDKNRMEYISAQQLFERYIYPKEFFGLPADAVIEELRFYFTDATGEIAVHNNASGGYLLEQAAE